MKNTSLKNIKDWATSRKTIKPTAIDLNEGFLVNIDYLDLGQTLPVLISPKFEEVSLSGWCKNNLGFIETELLKHGGILFRNFEVRSQSDFEQFLQSISLNLMHYMEGATPRTQLGDRVYTSTEYPSDQSIALHNELTYVTCWPMKICFFCISPATKGGETPLADVRKVYKRIDQRILERFRERGWMLVRNYHGELGLPWQKAFQCNDKASVERYCLGADIQFEWKPEDCLVTRQVRPALAKHAKTGEDVWFNHISFWNILNLDSKMRKSMTMLYREADLPYNTYYGDGCPIEPWVIENIREAYDQETVSFPWRAGDILLLDNMFVAHGRTSFTGPRNILAALGEPCSDRGL
jgi:Taurine catabolism dioxygenase TauD, TfdA family